MFPLGQTEALLLTDTRNETGLIALCITLFIIMITEYIISIELGKARRKKLLSCKEQLEKEIIHVRKKRMVHNSLS